MWDTFWLHETCFNRIWIRTNVINVFDKYKFDKLKGQYSYLLYGRLISLALIGQFETHNLRYGPRKLLFVLILKEASSLKKKNILSYE